MFFVLVGIMTAWLLVSVAWDLFMKKGPSVPQLGVS
jgi:uncharacterized membrane protein YwzB